MHVLLHALYHAMFLQNPIESFNESISITNHKTYLVEIKSSTISVDHNGYKSQSNHEMYLWMKHNEYPTFSRFINNNQSQFCNTIELK